MEIVITRSRKNSVNTSSLGIRRLSCSCQYAATRSTAAKIKTIEECAQDALKNHSDCLKSLLSQSESTFHAIADACKNKIIINSSQYDEIFDGMTNQRLAKRVDQFIKGIILMLEHCPNQLDEFLHILKEKGNVAFIEVAKKIAQSCK